MYTIYNVCVTTFMKAPTLELVNEMQDEFLVDISSDPVKLKCLNSFAKHQGVIEWLRDVTNGK